jgi:uncharacterized protein YejL (UPF0352 family)
MGTLRLSEFSIDLSALSLHFVLFQLWIMVVGNNVMNLVGDSISKTHFFALLDEEKT